MPRVTRPPPGIGVVGQRDGSYSMREYFYNHIKLEHLLCALILVARVGDIGSTYLITPKLRLEANPIAKKLGWWFAAATVLLCLVPYYSTAAGIILLVPSLMVSAANTGKIWFARAYGEKELHDLYLRLARTSKLSHALISSSVGVIFTAMIGFILLLLSPDPGRDWGYWFGVGFLAYAFTIGLYGSLFYIRLFQRARRSEEPRYYPVQQTPLPPDGPPSRTEL